MTLAIVFDSVGVGEWFILLAVVLIVVGPKRLPSTIRKFGNYYSKFRRAAESFKRQLMDMDAEINNAINAAEKEVEQAVSIPDEFDMPPEGPEAYGRQSVDETGYDPNSGYPDSDYYAMNDYPNEEQEPGEVQNGNDAGVSDGDKKTTAES